MFIAGLGLAWIGLTAAGTALGLDQRIRALMDLAILAGFGWAIWMIYGVWRARQEDKD